MRVSPTTILRLATAMLLGSTVSSQDTGPRWDENDKRKPRPSIPPPVKPRSRNTNDVVVCRSCDAVCERTRGSGAKAQALATGWKKHGPDEFECPECRRQQTEVAP